MNTLLQSFKITIGLLFMVGSMATAQINDKPILNFEVAIDDNAQKLEVNWTTCLENSIVKLLDNNLQPIKVQSLCKNKKRTIDISDLQNDLYYVQIEHYTGSGIQAVVKEPQTGASDDLINVQKADLDIHLYPNPAQNEITIEINGLESEGVLTILDLQGRKVQNKTINSRQFVLDISTLTQGVYFVRVEHEGGIGVQRMIKK